MNVEEALIAHFGLRMEYMNGDLSVAGQLVNQRRERNPDGPNYCDHLLVGQFVLKLNGYDPPYAKARFTRGTPCPGVGTP